MSDLLYASMYGHLEIVKVLLAAGADVNKSENDGWTPLLYASMHGHLEIVKVLVLAKAHVLSQTNICFTPLDVAKTNEIREFIYQHHPWQRRLPLILTRPHRSQRRYPMSPLAHIITATSGNVPSSHDDILFQLKMKVAEFL